MGEQEVKGQDDKQTTVTESDKQTVNDIPYSRFKEMVDEKNTVKSELEALQSKIAEDSEERKLKELEAKGEYEAALADIKSERDELREFKKGKDEEYKVERDGLLSKLSDEDQSVYGGLSNSKLRTHIDKQLKNNVPNVDSSPASLYQGYENLVDAAKDVTKGQLDKKAYAKIKEAFTSKISNA